MLEMTIPLESLKQSMDKKKVIKLVVLTEEDIMNMDMDQHIEIFKEAIKERSFNHVELINPGNK